MPEIDNSYIKDSDDRDQLLKLCEHELVNRKVLKVRWLRFCDDLALDVESDTAERVWLSLNYVHWDLLDENSNERVASSHEEFETFRAPAERLAGARIAKLDIRSDEGLSLTVYFSSGQYLRMEPCEDSEDDGIMFPGWELFCSDGNVIVVKMQQGKWKFQSRKAPYSP